MGGTLWLPCLMTTHNRTLFSKTEKGRLSWKRLMPIIVALFVMDTSASAHGISILSRAEHSSGKMKQLRCLPFSRGQVFTTVEDKC